MEKNITPRQRRHKIPKLEEQNENEIVWDLTSPSARKYQIMVSEKKTSTPNQTPTRSRRELRPRVALCKKNIAMTEDKSGELVNQLAFLNDMVNTQKNTIILTPPQSVKRQNTSDCESPVENPIPVLPGTQGFQNFTFQIPKLCSFIFSSKPQYQ